MTDLEWRRILGLLSLRTGLALSPLDAVLDIHLDDGAFFAPDDLGRVVQVSYRRKNIWLFRIADKINGCLDLGSHGSRE